MKPLLPLLLFTSVAHASDPESPADPPEEVTPADEPQALVEPMDVEAPAPPETTEAWKAKAEPLLYKNLEVKKCFVPLFQSGRAPATLDLLFTAWPDGSVSDTRIEPVQWEGSQFELCMRSAVPTVGLDPPSAVQHVAFTFQLGSPDDRSGQRSRGGRRSR